MISVGETLRRERLRRHLELAQIASELKISARMLEAIEEEKFEKLPGGVFTKSFVRQYARRLGLDEEQIVREVQQLIQSPFAIDALVDAEPEANLAPMIRVPRLEAWESLSEKRFSRFSWMSAAALVVAAMLVCSIVYSQWQRRHAPGFKLAQETPSQASGLPGVPPAGSPGAPAVSEAAPPSPEAGDAQSRATGTEEGESVSTANAKVRVELTAREKVWISARADGRILFSGTLDENETRTVEANDKLLLRVGDAGALDVTLNGKSLGALGAKGQPRTVQFTSGGFQTVAVFSPVLPL